tara:strand:- start:69 stop:305 length:237 start_codon:yes stop_codon:yes gene_type:complete
MSEKLQKVGAFWKPREGGKSAGTGVITVSGMKQKFVMFKNNFKEGEKQPDYILMSGDEPEVDEWEAKKKAEPDDEVPF